MTNNYSNWIMTSKFADVEAAAAQSLNKIEWVRFVTTSQTFTLADLAGFNDLTLQTITIQQQKNVSSVKVTGSTATVTGVFASTGNPETYYANTIMLVGKYNNVEFLAGSTIATGQAMRLPADSPDEYVEFTVRSQISVTSTDTISTTVDPMTSATNERVNAEVEGLQTQIDETKGAISSLASSTTTGLSGKVGKSGNETIDGVKTFTSTITGSVSGNAGNVLATLTDEAASSELPSTTANTGIKAIMQTVRNSLKWLTSRFDSSGRALTAVVANSATTATKLTTARKIGLSGDVTGTAQSFDGSENKTIQTKLSKATAFPTSTTYSGLAILRKRGATAVLRVAGWTRIDTNNATNSFDEIILTIPDGWLPLGEHVGTFFSSNIEGIIRMGYVHIYEDGTCKITSFFSSIEESYTGFGPSWNGQIVYVLPDS